MTSEATGLPTPIPTEDSSSAVILTPKFGVSAGVNGILWEMTLTTGLSCTVELTDVKNGSTVYEGGYVYGKPCKIPRALFPLLVVPKLGAPYTVEDPF